jgi:hypothetical protein
MDRQNLTTEEQSSPQMRQKTRSTLLVSLIVISCISVMGILYFINNRPTFLKIPIQPPPDIYGEGEWSFTSYSTFLSTDNTPFIGSRYYILRKTAFVSSDQDRQLNQSWDSLISYFDEKLSHIGWNRTEKEDLCYVMLPEAKFLKYGEDGYVQYLPKNNTNLITQASYGETICLAIWSSGNAQSGTPSGFNVVLLTSKPSPFTKFFDIFSE